MSDNNQPINEEPSVSQLGNLLADASSYADATLDKLKAAVKKSVLNIAAQVSFILLGMMMLLVAVSFIMYGIAQSMNQFLGDQTWLGFVITGSIVIFLKILVSKIIRTKAMKASIKSNDILKHQAELTKDALSKTAHHLKQGMSDIFDVKKWTEEYPFYATGAAAVASFVIAGGMTTADTQETPVAKPPVPVHESAFMPMLVRLAEDVLKETVIPPVKEYLANLTNPREAEHS